MKSQILYDATPYHMLKLPTLRGTVKTQDHFKTLLTLKSWYDLTSQSIWMLSNTAVGNLHLSLAVLRLSVAENSNFLTNVIESKIM